MNNLQGRGKAGCGKAGMGKDWLATATHWGASPNSLQGLGSAGQCMPRIGVARTGYTLGCNSPTVYMGSERRGMPRTGRAWTGYIIGSSEPTVYKGKDRWGRAGHGKARLGRATHWGESPDSLPELKLKLKRERSKR